MHTVHEIAALRARIAGWRGQGERIALVPTMGNLHRGHLHLIERARAVAARVVVSIFVNPLQFGPNEDYARYPRTLAADSAQLQAAQVDLLFAPEAAVLYPRGQAQLTRISVPDLAGELCGEFRPGHFDGVATVVNLLFNLVQPDVALFGEKDYQQLAVIRRMVADLHLPVQVLGVPTQRDADGLALSSRNQYLSAEERARASVLYATLREIAVSLEAGNRDFAGLVAIGRSRLLDAGFEPQYLEIRAPDLGPAQSQNQQFVVLAAAYLGRTRLIDNIQTAAV
ncbi:MAG: pantoate--beta-alanine ligase [Gammaproteobacteria bacterium]|jgi:pantoate--beta-alanine ligase